MHSKCMLSLKFQNKPIVVVESFRQRNFPYTFMATYQSPTKANACSEVASEMLKFNITQNVVHEEGRQTQKSAKAEKTPKC